MGSGLGVIISDDGYVLINMYVVILGGVVVDLMIWVIIFDGCIFEVIVVGIDLIYDLVVIKLKGVEGFMLMDFVDLLKFNVGDMVVVLGVLLGLVNFVIIGIVSVLNCSI